MKRFSFTGLGLLIAVLLIYARTGAPDQIKDHVGTVAPQSNQKIGVGAEFGKVPLYFVPNKGQLDDRVAYYVQGKDKTVYFTSEGITFALASPAESGPGRWIVKLDFIGSNPDTQPLGLEETGAVVSYFRGQPENWRAGIPTYSKIIYPSLWPGIDLVYYGTVNKLKYEFIVHPGADPSKIRLAYRGAKSVLVDENGRLQVTTPVNSFRDDVPAAYQDIKGERVQVSLAYKLDGASSDESSGLSPKTMPERLILREKQDSFSAENPDSLSDEQERKCVYGFEVGDYDRSLPLVLDPAVLVYCGYIGGSGADSGSGISTDSSGSVYIVGQTNTTETSFPVAVGPDLTYGGGYSDVFVAKVNAAGTALIYCGYIGGSSSDEPGGIAVDSSGNAHIMGLTYSTQTSFPVMVGPDLTHNGYGDVFIAKLNASGTSLIYCGYIGGSSDDYGYGLAVDASGNAYITGRTGSSEATFPVLAGPDLTYNNNEDAFVAKVNAAGTALLYCGYIGGLSAETGRGIAVDSSGNAHIMGDTLSPEFVFPVTVGPDLTSNGNYDAFVAKVNPSGTALLYCGYIGGSALENGNGIALDDSGNAYVIGETLSTEANFPENVGPDLTSNGAMDAFVAKINASGTSLVYCGFIGGSSIDQGRRIVVDNTGNAYVTGTTQSTQTTFPVTAGPDLTHNGGRDAFVAKVNAAGTSLVYCGFIGGSADDWGLAIAVDGPGNSFITGSTTSTEATFPIAIGPDLTFNGGQWDTFIAKVSYWDPWAAKHAVGDFDGDGTEEVAVDFAAAGIYLYDSGAWSQISSANPESLLAADVDGDNVDELVADLGATGLWLWNAGAWNQLSGVNVESFAAGDVDADGTDEIVGDFGAVGLWLYNGGAWSQLSGVNADYITVANVDGGGGDEIFGDFGATGLWVWNTGTWTILSALNPDYVMTGEQTGAKFIAGDFGPTGLWLWSMPGLCTQLSGLDADYMIAANTDGDTEDEIIGDFGATGLWHCEGGLWTGSGFTWSILSSVNADFMIRADIDGNGTDEVVADFGAIGLWLWNAGSWSQTSGVNPEYQLVADVDGDNADEIFVDFGALGLWMWNAGAWSQVSALNPD